MLQNFTNNIFSTFWVKNAFFSTLIFLNDEILIFFVCRFSSFHTPETTNGFTIALFHTFLKVLLYGLPLCPLTKN